MNSTNSDFLSSSSNVCPFIVSIIGNYIMPCLSVAGFFFNLLCSITLFKIVKQKSNGHMIKYLLVKCINDCFIFLFQSMSIVYFCSNCTDNWNFFAIIWYIWFFYYLESCTMLIHSLMEIFAALDCLIHIKNSSNMLRSKYAPLVIILISLIFSFIYYIYTPFNYIIVNLKVNNHTYFVQKYSEFYQTNYSVIFRLGNIILRDFLPIIGLFIINYFIWNTIRKAVKRKRKLINEKYTEQKVILSSAKRAELKSILLIVFSSLIYILGHANPVISNILRLTGQYSIYTNCIYHFGNIIYFLSYALNIFVLFYFNNCFKSKLLSLFLGGKNRMISWMSSISNSTSV